MAPLRWLATAVGTEPLRYDRLAVRLRIDRLSRGLFRGGDDDYDEKECCEHRFHFNLPDFAFEESQLGFCIFSRCLSERM